MKKLLLFFLTLIFFSFKGLAQDPELLSQGWYFTSMTIDGEDHVPNYDNYYYYIFLFFNDNGGNNDFKTKACQELQSDILYQNDNEFYLTNLTENSEDCNPGFDDFESLYFDFFYNNQENSFTYEIINNNEELLLIITDQLGNEINYTQKPPINPFLFQTWELTHIYLDLNGYITISDINPNITPFLKVYENLEYVGVGACNSFNGNFFISSNGNEYYYNWLFSENFEQTNNTCTNDEHSNVESIFFLYFEGQLESYFIQFADNEQYLYLYPTALGYYLKFKRNNNLSTEENSTENITIHPNPVTDQLHIAANSNDINSLTIYTLTGKKVMKIENFTNEIDVSTLNNGVYFIEIFSDSEKIIKRFIKH